MITVMWHWIYLYSIVSAYARLRLDATPTLITDRGARPEDYYNPYPELYSGATVSVLIGTVHPVIVPADVRLFRAVHLCLRARCCVLIPHRCILGIYLYGKSPKTVEKW